MSINLESVQALEFCGFGNLAAQEIMRRWNGGKRLGIATLLDYTDSFVLENDRGQHKDYEVAMDDMGLTSWFQKGILNPK